ncbi:GtrA family protein [Streptomyces sp. NPDC051561]|uniref:GtrA family protein n=1 Tax=Streptomyces sp. NPDC051561 TaxID=3365658 RepID=UPI0037BDA170
MSTTSPAPPSLRLRLHAVLRRTWREVASFGVVGALAFVVDNGGYNLLVFGLPGGSGGPMESSPVVASVLATTVAVAASWVGNRYWTYRGQRRENVVHELVLFALVNVIGIVITAGTVSLSRHLLGLDSPLSDNVARLLGWAIATVFRFFTYRRFVFVAS